jgi:4-hydroxyacetophenone monooxygenase
MFEWTAQGYRFKEVFPTGLTIRTYLEYVTATFGIKKHMSFNCEVTRASWNQASSKWNIVIKHADGSAEVQDCNFIISCSGLFSTPNLPDINGIHSCKKPLFHTSQWSQNVDCQEKDIALIGTGSTGCQLAPALAHTAKSLTVYQRTPNWIAPNIFYNSLVPDEVNWLYDNMPYYWNWIRYGTFYKSLNFLRLQVRDQEWEASGGSVSEINAGLRAFLTNFMHEHFKDRPDLVAKMLPNVAPSVRRLVVDNGFYDAVLRDNVELVTNRIDRITETGILTTDGKERRFDMIVLGSGWKVSQYLWPVDYVGVEGMTLQKLWEKDGARSYLGMTMPHYPNLFTLYGPNHQPRAGSLFSCCEIWARYAVSSIVGIIERGAKSMELKREVFDEYQARLNLQAKKAIWETEGAGYFVNKHGRQGVNNPFTNAQYHPMIRQVNFDDYIVT